MATGPPRKLFSLGEWLTLLGMGLVVVSVALVWGEDAPEAINEVAAIYISARNYTRTGYELPLGALRVGWVVVICAVTCSALLLLEPARREKRLFLAIQTALAIAILILALLHIGPYAGVVLALLGGLLLLGGAVARYR